MKKEADSLDSSLITQLKDVPQAPVDAEEKMQDFCSQTCLSIKAAPVGSKSQCNMCSTYSTVRDVGLVGHPGFYEFKETACVTVVRHVSSLQSKHEILYQGVNHKICSNPCFYRFCDINNFCVNCHTHCNTPVQLKVVDGSRKFCTAGCLALFKQVTPCRSEYPVQAESSSWRLSLCLNSLAENQNPAAVCHVLQPPADVPHGRKEKQRRGRGAVLHQTLCDGVQDPGYQCIRCWTPAARRLCRITSV